MGGDHCPGCSGWSRPLTLETIGQDIPPCPGRGHEAEIARLRAERDALTVELNDAMQDAFEASNLNTQLRESLNRVVREAGDQVATLERVAAAARELLLPINEMLLTSECAAIEQHRRAALRAALAELEEP